MDDWVVERGFEAVADTLRRQAEADPSFSAQVCVEVGGAPVVDAWIGPELDRDSLVCLFSSSKGLSALSLALLVQRGRLELDRPVADYWPEFAAAGKAGITVRTVLTHQAGLPEVDGGLSWKDLVDGHAEERLAAQRPLWRPGSAFGYHAATLGVLMGELCRRVTGESLQAFYERELRRPVDADAYLGLPEEHEPRVVEVPVPDLSALAGAMPVDQGQLADLIAGLITDPEAYTELTHSRRARALGLPALGGVGSARGLARVYSSAVIGADRPPVLDAATVAEFGQVHCDGTDLCSGLVQRFGVVFQKPLPRRPFASYQAIGHDGAGGSLAFADPQVGMAFGFITNRLAPPGGEPRADELARAARECCLRG
ncbi:serine hydrolase domain-containing protein [Jiangella anatolica]|uniref:serine hydrolase domain-containing protein n=1 Tax=Jiangella anatolica TaxID=2670374 RepID=UPI0013140D31|nr:serine hydrolase domain-containing protein [Jiangella anatolica]